MEAQALLDNVQELTDLELAVLLSLVAREHCLLIAEDDLVDDLAAEVSLIVSERFGLSYAVVEPEQQTSVDDFGEAVLEKTPTQFSVEDKTQQEILRERLASVAFRSGSLSTREEPNLDNRTLVNVVIAKGFNFAPPPVQIRALELIRRGRIFSHTTVRVVPKAFIFLPIISASSKTSRLIPHLNDRIFMSHEHHVNDGFPTLEELEESESSDRGSKIVLRRSSQSIGEGVSRIDQNLIEKIRSFGENATMTAEIRRYMQDIVTFLRLERGVDGGITPYASNQFVRLAKYLAPLHGLNFVTPSLIVLAARKIYPHRLVVAEPDRERSMQYGSNLAAVKDLIEGLTPEEIVESVLNTVSSPI